MASIRCEGMDFTGSLVLVIHLEFFLLVDRICHLAAHDDSFIEDELSQSLSQFRIFAHPFGHNVARPFERFVHRAHT